jgi:hypothetical protein
MYRKVEYNIPQKLDRLNRRCMCARILATGVPKTETDETTSSELITEITELGTI